MPGHVCMGKEVSLFNYKNLGVVTELVSAGCSGLMADKLILSAQIATKAINKMLASEAQ